MPDLWVAESGECVCHIPADNKHQALRMLEHICPRFEKENVCQVHRIVRVEDEVGKAYLVRLSPQPA